MEATIHVGDKTIKPEVVQLNHTGIFLLKFREEEHKWTGDEVNYFFRSIEEILQLAKEIQEDCEQLIANKIESQSNIESTG